MKVSTFLHAVKGVWPTILFGLSFFCPLAAQGISGSISGTVVDQSGLPVLGASVKLINLGTGSERDLISNDNGVFEFLSLLPGTYTIEVEMPGFKKFVSREHSLIANQRLAAGRLRLEIGELSETVEVSGNVGAVQSVSGERSVAVARQQLENLQSLSRDPMEMWIRSPGIISDGVANSSIQRPVNLREMNVMGGRRNNKNFTLDGVSALNTGNNQESSVTPDIDAVEEVQIMLSNHQAEYGRSSGATINLVTRSGSRDFHGSLYYYRQHEDLNANSFFNNKNGIAKTPNRGQSRGLSIGGPIYIPGKFNTDKEKLFFFFAASAQPRKFPPSLWQFTMPTELERQGDFSQTFTPQGNLVVIKDPVTGQPFPDNKIPANRLDTFGTELLGVLPEPNFEDPEGRHNFVQTGLAFEIPRRTEVLKVDYNIGSNYVLNGRYTQDKNDNINFSPAAFKLGPHRLFRPGKNLSFRLNQTFSSTLINETTVGYNRLRLDQSPDGEEGLNAVSRATLGVTLGQFNPENNPLNMVPNMVFGALQSGVSSPTVQSFNMGQRELQQQFSVADNVSWVRGRHVWKLGIYVERGTSTIFPSAGNGALNFSVDANNPNDAGYAYANAVLGNFRTYTEPVTTFGERNYRFWNVEWYGQDSWRVSDKLSLEYGVRFYWHPPETERDGRISSFDPTLFDPSQEVRLFLPARDSGGALIGQDPVTGQTVPSNQIGAIVPGSGDPANGFRLGSGEDLVKLRSIYVAPRLGFAFDPMGQGKTAIRGGFGIFFDRSASRLTSRLSDNPPLFQEPTIFNGNLDSLLGATGATFPQNVWGLSPDGNLSTTMNFSLGVQQRLTNLFVLDVSYVGSLSRHMPEARDINTLPTGTRFLTVNEDPTRPGRALADPFLRPYLGYNFIRVTEWSSNANYNSMQVVLTRRFGNRINFDANYTWAKALDFASSDDGLRSVLLGGQRDYGRSDLAANHSFNSNLMIELPGLRTTGFTRALFDGWRLTMGVQIQSGYPRPFRLQAPGLDFTGSTEGARPNIVGEVNLPKDERSFSRHFNTDAVASPSPGAFGITQPGDVDFGNASKEGFNQPGFNNWNAAVTKSFSIWEDHELQISGEFYNFPNHTQFRRADDTARFNAAGQQTNSRFGEYISAYGPRTVQLGIRYRF